MKFCGTTGTRSGFRALRTLRATNTAAILPTVFQLARRGALPSEIAEYLCTVVTQHMGLSSSVEMEMPVAEKVRLLKLSLLPEKA
ncbi:MAG: hypothetical protein WBW33_20650 [Bryobacteraceae bacterium]